jgi:hypothetical protein
MNLYRYEQLNKQMEIIERILTSISEKNQKELGVTEILKKDPLLPYDKAVRMGMQEAANNAMFQVKVLATSLDRVISMVLQMVERGELDVTSLLSYKKRLELLTNFDRILEEIDPLMSYKFAHV